MANKVQLRLLASTGMNKREEHEVIRFPRSARNYFAFGNNAVVIGKGEYQVSLTVKKAYKEDVRRLATMVNNGRVSDQEALATGFVTRRTQQRVNRKEGQDVWISDGVGNITIGADPEFGLVDQQGILRRGNHIVLHDGQFGSDGPSVEVRPQPASNHLAIVNRIESILSNPPEPAEGFQWIGGATYKDCNRVYWFGGHIHLGRPSALEEGQAYPVYQRIAAALDGLLALPMVRFDTPEPFRRRNGCSYGYGKAGDIRADYPEGDRFEYRVLSGLWLTHPTLAKVALGAAKCIAETAYGRIADQKFDLDWAQAPASRAGLLKSFGLKRLREVSALINEGRPNKVTNEHLKEWKRQIRSLDLFENYSEELRALIALAEASPTEFTLDIRRNWLTQQPLLPKKSTKAALNRALKAVEEK